MKREEIVTELDSLILKADKLDKLDKHVRTSLPLIQESPRILSASYVELLTSTTTVMRYVEADVHYRLSEQFLNKLSEGFAVSPRVILGLLQSCKAQLMAGFFLRSRVLATADAMNDVLEQAEELLANDYKDGACVLIGGALETTLNKMLEQHGSEEDQKIKWFRDKNKRLLDLDKYDKVTHGQIVAFMDLRNEAAHGNYQAVRKEQVADFLKFSRDFIMRWYTPKLT
jgi:hypothetical protein